jgi:PleD family two-component response regulator
MGPDGAQGLLSLRRAGGTPSRRTVHERRLRDAESGGKLDAAVEVLPLDEIAAAIVHAVTPWAAPCAQEESHVTDGSHAPRAGEPAVSRHPIRVLLVDDQAIIGEAVRRMLAAEPGVEFLYCGDPTKAMQAAADFRPTVILQDLVMPEVDGLTMLRYYRANPVTRDIPTACQ